MTNPPFFRLKSRSSTYFFITFITSIYQTTSLPASKIEISLNVFWGYIFLLLFHYIYYKYLSDNLTTILPNRNNLECVLSVYLHVTFYSQVLQVFIRQSHYLRTSIAVTWRICTWLDWHINLKTMKIAKMWPACKKGGLASIFFSRMTFIISKELKFWIWGHLEDMHLVKLIP